MVLSASQKRQKSNCLQAFTVHALCYHQNCLGFLAPTWKKLSPYPFFDRFCSQQSVTLVIFTIFNHFPTTSAISLVSTSVFCVGSCPFGSKFSADLTHQSGANLWGKNNHLSCNYIDLFRLIQYMSMLQKPTTYRITKQTLGVATEVALALLNFSLLPLTAARRPNLSFLCKPRDCTTGTHNSEHTKLGYVKP